VVLIGLIDGITKDLQKKIIIPFKCFVRSILNSILTRVPAIWGVWIHIDQDSILSAPFCYGEISLKDLIFCGRRMLSTMQISSGVLPSDQPQVTTNRPAFYSLPCQGPNLLAILSSNAGSITCPSSHLHIFWLDGCLLLQWLIRTVLSS
jgi:hypothetical protein